MDLDLLIVTIYGAAYAMWLLIISYKMGHEFHHWRFGLLTITATLPMIPMYIAFNKDYYLTVIIIGLITGITSFLMDYHDFKTWLRKRKNGRKK